MVTFKKSYAEQLFQLALALSLLNVQQDNIFGSQLEFQYGSNSHRNSWELEMLHAVPMTNYPYANRKAMIPLIEDLVRFDRLQHSTHSNSHNITAYLLVNGSHNQTNQDLENSVGAVAVETAQQNYTTNPTEYDFFANAELSEEEASVLEQNLSDLRDFGDVPILGNTNFNPYFGLPMKDEPLDNYDNFDVYQPIKVEESSSNACKNQMKCDSDGDSGNPSEVTNSTTDQFINMYKIYNSTKNTTESEEGVQEVTIKVNTDTIKKEEDLENDDDENNDDGYYDFEETFTSIELTPEEIETVEVLWKQDVDLGYSLPPVKESSETTESQSKENEDDIEKLKALEELKLEATKEDDKELVDEWSGIPFTIDNETGEYIRLPLQLEEILDDVLHLADISNEELKPESEAAKSSTSDQSIVDTSTTEEKIEKFDEKLPTTSIPSVERLQNEIEVSSLPSPLFNLDDAVSELDEIDMMIQSSNPSFHHHKNNHQNYGGPNSAFRQSTGFHQTRGPLSRGVSMEQRLQDIANLFNPIPGMGVGMGVGEMAPYSHYPAHYPYQASAGIPPQHSQFPHSSHYAGLSDFNTTQPHYGHNLGSAVTSSMHLTNSSHESDSTSTTNGGYKMDHDMMYYSNTSSEMNHTTDGFINSILNDEDLHLMDMNVSENFCNLRMIDNSTSNNSSILSGGSHHHTHPSHIAHQSHPQHGISMHHSMQSSSLHGTSASGAGATVVGATDGSLASGAAGCSGGDRLDASSDSAVSSMGSERVPSLSDGEWGEGSDSAQDYHQSKYGGPYDYSYSTSNSNARRQPPVAQKKHQMYGKRYFQEQTPSHQTHSTSHHLPIPIKYEYDSYNSSSSVGTTLHHNNTIEGAVGLTAHADVKYSSYLDFNGRPTPTQQPSLPRSEDIISHNHTYALPQGSGLTPRPQQRDKKSKKSHNSTTFDEEEQEHLSRDEKRARSLNIPITVMDIINLPMDEFNERLSKYDLTENQLSLIRDIRRRGKNKVAAQNCRKRKLDQIVSLEDEVKEVRQRKEQLHHDRDMLFTEKKRITSKFQALHSLVFQYLRDADGNLCSSNDYTLQQAADGSIYLLRREGSKADGNITNIHNNHNHHHHNNQKD